MFKQVSIIGFGLIGSSIARSLRYHNATDKLICVDYDEKVNKKVSELGIADIAGADMSLISDSDLVIIAVPVRTCESVAEKISPYLQGTNAIVTDVGSVKKFVIDSVTEILPEGVDFVPGHPIAGTEYSGPEAGFRELFINRWCILTPEIAGKKIAREESVNKIAEMWRLFGSVVEIMDAERHDKILAITSHLPHLIAYTIVGTATDLEEDLKSEVIKFSASGFRDFTRIAASDPVMWRDIFMSNKESVLDILQRFDEDLTALQKFIRRSDGKNLEEFFTKTRNVRKKVIEAGQDSYVYPISLGRKIES